MKCVPKVYNLKSSLMIRTSFFQHLFKLKCIFFLAKLSVGRLIHMEVIAILHVLNINHLKKKKKKKKNLNISKIISYFKKSVSRFSFAAFKDVKD